MTSAGIGYAGVIGAGDPDHRLEAFAEEVGALLGERGAILICGGLGGVMESACRGAKRVGGVTVGILPGSDRSGANPHLDVAIATGLGEARNALVVRASDGLIAIGGGFGTLSEIGLALRIGRPVVGLDTWELSRRGKVSEALPRVSSPREAVDLLFDLSL